MQIIDRCSRSFRFTDRTIERLPAHDPQSPSREVEYSDTVESGLRLRVGKNGRRFFQHRFCLKGRKGVLTIGEFPAVTTEAARQQVREWKRLLAKGLDPRTAAQPAPAPAELTFARFVEEHYLPTARISKRSSDLDERKLRHDLLPRYGHQPLAALTAATWQQYVLAIAQRASGTTANRHRALLSSIYSLAERLGLVEHNPLRKVVKFKEPPGRVRYLNDDELSRFLAALDACGHPAGADALRLLLATGARKSEILGLQWPDVDLVKGTLKLRRTKSGRDVVIPINEVARTVLEQRREHRAADTEQVFPSWSRSRHLTELRKTFKGVCARAGITDFRLHDLRHHFASTAVSAGATLYETQHLLGHASPTMTQKYAHLAPDRLRDASARVAAKLTAVQTTP